MHVREPARVRDEMAAQVVAILFLILDEAVPASLNFHEWGTMILFIALALSLISAAQYVRQFVLQMLPRGGAGSGGS